MPKFNPIFTFSKINLKLTKKSSYFIFSNYFIKKLLEFYIVSSHYNLFEIYPLLSQYCHINIILSITLNSILFTFKIR